MTVRQPVHHSGGQPAARWLARVFLFVVMLPLALLISGGAVLSVTGSSTIVTAKGFVVSAGGVADDAIAVVAGIDASDVDAVMRGPEHVIVRHGTTRYVAHLSSIADDVVRSADLARGDPSWPPLIYPAMLTVATDSSVHPRPEPPIPADADVIVEIDLGWTSYLEALLGPLLVVEICCMACR